MKSASASFPVLITSLFLFGLQRAVRTEDCNDNGVDDTMDIAPATLPFGARWSAEFPVIVKSVIAADFDGNGTLDLAGLTDAVVIIFGSRRCANSSAVVSVLLSQGDGSFPSVQEYSLGDAFCHQTSFLSADLNGDGSLDLAGGTPEHVFVLFNKGDGTFFDPVLHAGDSRSVVAADLDNDGDLDLAAGGPFDVSVLLNSGAGAFAPAEQFPVGSGPTALIAADLNGDADLDLVTANGSSGNLSVLLGDGRGAFAVARNYATLGPPSSLIATDLDGDGLLDLATANPATTDPNDNSLHDGSVSILFNAGDGSLRPAVRHAADGVSPTSLRATDIDNDGKLDLYTSGVGGWFVLRNGGGGRFELRAETPDCNPHEVPVRASHSVLLVDLDGRGGLDTAFTDVCHGVSFWLDDAPARASYSVEGASALFPADMNGDGSQDLVVVQNLGRVSVLLKTDNGDFRFRQPDIYDRDHGSGSLITPDLNGDGILDLVTAGAYVSERSRVAVYLNSGEARLGDPAYYLVNDNLNLTATASDFDRDGAVDIAALNLRVATYDIAVLFNQGDGTFRNPSRRYPVRDVVHSFLLPADLDGRNGPDLAVPVDGGTVVLLNNGDGTFQSAIRYAHPSGLVILAEDFNTDGALDLATLGGESGDFFVQWNQGDGTFGTAARYPAAAINPRDQMAADLNGDEMLDLVAGSNPLEVLLNRGDGTFAPAREFFIGVTQDPVSQRVYSIRAADFDLDGDLDLAAALSGGYVPDCACLRGGYVSILRNDGAGEFGVPVQHSVRNPVSLAAVDLNGDGKVDLAAASWVELSVLVNAGDGTFHEPVHHFLDEGANFLVPADLDGDQDTDIAAHSGGYQFAVFWNETAPPASLDLDRNGVPDECEASTFHRGDPNGDGETNITDGITLLNSLFLGGRAPTCKESADVNNNGTIDLSDGINLLNWLFLGGPEPAVPGPTTAPCGLDTDLPGSPGDLGCETYGFCP